VGFRAFEQFRGREGFAHSRERVPKVTGARALRRKGGADSAREVAAPFDGIKCGKRKRFPHRLKLRQVKGVLHCAFSIL
jgi:hypothetical protein